VLEAEAELSDAQGSARFVPGTGYNRRLDGPYRSRPRVSPFSAGSLEVRPKRHYLAAARSGRSLVAARIPCERIPGLHRYRPGDLSDKYK
jgi:hypothetical protein